MKSIINFFLILIGQAPEQKIAKANRILDAVKSADNKGRKKTLLMNFDLIHHIHYTDSWIHVSAKVILTDGTELFEMEKSFNEVIDKVAEVVHSETIKRIAKSE